MKIADASLAVPAEQLKTRKFFTINCNLFQTDRVRRGRRYHPLRDIE